jgi:hypothetical protein
LRLPRLVFVGFTRKRVSARRSIAEAYQTTSLTT